MQTSSFFLYAGPGRVSIARFAPRNTPAGFRIYKPLAPGPWFNTASYADYLNLYTAQLDLLDPQSVWDQLHVLAGGADPVLLCYEKPPFTSHNFCHRRMVADWFQLTLGKSVTELGHHHHG